MIRVIECSLKDVKTLAEMNKQWIKEDKANGILNYSFEMDSSQLIGRMTDWLNTGYKAFFIKDESTVAGYIICDMTKEPVFLRQFYIVKSGRRQHYGKTGFKMLLEKLGVSEIELSVDTKNETGIKFWESLGFEEQWKRMKLKVK